VRRAEVTAQPVEEGWRAVEVEGHRQVGAADAGRPELPENRQVGRRVLAAKGCEDRPQGVHDDQLSRFRIDGQGLIEPAPGLGPGAMRTLAVPVSRTVHAERPRPRRQRRVATRDGARGSSSMSVLTSRARPQLGVEGPACGPAGCVRQQDA
jgi:hypothetical protein